MNLNASISGGLSGVPLNLLAVSAPSSNGGRLGPSGLTPSTEAAAARDSLVSSLPDINSTVNGLAQAATAPTVADATASDAAEPNLTVPPLPSMPAQKSAQPAPADDHGKSNIVFSDEAVDGAFIR